MREGRGGEEWNEGGKIWEGCMYIGGWYHGRNDIGGGGNQFYGGSPLTGKEGWRG